MRCSRDTTLTTSVTLSRTVGLAALACAAGVATTAAAQSADPNLTPIPPVRDAVAPQADPAPGPGVDADGMDIRIDFSNFLSTTPGNWNNVGNLGGLTGDLIDFETGDGTGVSVDGSGSAWRDFFADDAGEFPEQDWLIQPSTVDGSGLLTGLLGVYTFENVPDGTYQIDVVSARTTFDYQNTFTINGDLADRTFLGTPVRTPWGSTSDGLIPGNWLIWDDVEPDGGTIVLELQADPGTLGLINAMRIFASGPGCRADLDGDGELTIFDFLEFQNLFDAGDPAADFDGDGELTLFDFLAFQNEFDAGCE